jgi:hypothetical protein
MECYKDYGASAMAALVVFRSLFGAGLPVAVEPMVRAVSRLLISRCLLSLLNVHVLIVCCSYTALWYILSNAARCTMVRFTTGWVPAVASACAISLPQVS